MLKKKIEKLITLIENTEIEEIEVGSPSDVDGAYLISNIPACENCKYTLKVLYIGYKEYST